MRMHKHQKNIWLCKRGRTNCGELNFDGLSEWTPHNAAIARSFCSRIMITLHSSLMSSDVPAPLSTRFVSVTTNHSKSRFRCIPPPLLEEVHMSLRDMLEAGAIRPSQSPWCNTAVLVRKKDGTLRFCVDFRRLNMWTKKDSYPLPRIQEVLESMAGAAHFSTMDFKSGFWQVRMAPESQQYTACSRLAT